jgi:hypothetical protein
MFEFIQSHQVAINPTTFVVAVDQLDWLISNERPESELQSHLEKHPQIISQQFAHCHHVFPQVRLGERYQADFLCLEANSYGNEWIAVEIESTNKKICNKSGRKTAYLEHALQQIRDWRNWVCDNIDYARRSKSENGLGLQGIHPKFSGCVIIGRHTQEREFENHIVQQVLKDELIEIRSWDGIVKRARERADLFRSVRSYFENQPLGEA